MTPHGHSWRDMETFFLPWAAHFIASWLAFLGYMCVDYYHYRRGSLSASKLPSRHPLTPFWESQTHMIPLVLYNQLVVWPLVSLLLIWPQWALNRVDASDVGWYSLPWLVGGMLISDQMWYWTHRFMHTPFAWKHWHKMHHIAEQAALSATYVHAVEYACWTTAMQLPFALTGFPLYVYVGPLFWGCGVGAGAHSGYSKFADADKHNAHHLYHNVNFGLLMIADAMYGTHWSPGDPAPHVWSEAVKIWNDFPDVHGNEAASDKASTMEKPWENPDKLKVT